MLASIKTKGEIKSAFDSKEDSILYSNSYVAEFIRNGYQYYMICSLVKLGNEPFRQYRTGGGQTSKSPNEKDMEELFSGGSYITSNSIAKLVFKGNEIEFPFINPDFIRVTIEEWQTGDQI